MKTTRTQASRIYNPIIVFIVSVLVLGLAERVLAADANPPQISHAHKAAR